MTASDSTRTGSGAAATLVAPPTRPIDRSTRIRSEVATGDPIDPPNPPSNDGGDEPGGEAWWPEARFFLGSASLFVLTYVLLTGLLVAALMFFGKSTPTAIMSGSMHPTIRVGDIVLNVEPDFEAVGPGSVVLFAEPGTGRLTTHRIVSVDAAGTYRTQGDANDRVDSAPIGHDDIVGVGRFLVPYAGYPAYWLAVGAYLPFLLLVVTVVASAYGVRWAIFPEYDPWSDEEESRHDEGSHSSDISEGGVA